MSTIKSVLVIQKNAVFWCLAFIGLVRYEELCRSRRGFYLPRPVHSTYSPGGTPGNSWWRCTAQFLKSWPYFRPKNVFFHTRNRASKIQTRSDLTSVIITEIRSPAKSFLKIHFEFAYYSSCLFTSAEREVKDSRRSGMYQSYHFLTRLGMQSL